MSIHIRKSEIKIFLLMLPFMEPYIIQSLSHRLHMIFLLLKVTSSVAIIFFHFYKNGGKLTFCFNKNGEGKKSTHVTVFSVWSVVLLYLLLNTIVQGDLTRNYFVGTLSTFSLLLLLRDSKEDMRGVLNVLILYLEILVYVNLLFMILYPSGMYVSESTGNTTNWILGYDNFYDQTFLPGMALCLCYSYINKSIRRIIPLIVAMHISTFITMPGTVLICLLLLDGLYFVGFYRLKKLFSFAKMTLVIVLVTIGIVFFNIQTTYGAFIFELIDKDVSFTGRTTIWELSISQIFNSPIFGYGFSDGTARLAKMNYILRGAFNAHNMLLEYLWEGGIVVAVMLAILLVVTALKLKDNNTSRISQIMSVGLAIILVSFLTKAYMQTFPPFVYILWGLVDYVTEIEGTAIEKHGGIAFGRKNSLS